MSPNGSSQLNDLTVPSHFMEHPEEVRSNTQPISSSEVNEVAKARQSERVLTRINSTVSKYCMFLAVAGLFGIIAVVSIQVFWRYVLNDTPSWAERSALVLILYVTMFGAAAGVRDAGHIGMESLLVLAPEWIRRKLEILIHVLVAAFGGVMAWNGAVLALSVIDYKIPTLPISEAFNYLPLPIAGTLFMLFSVEHIVAIFRGEEVIPSWH